MSLVRSIAHLNDNTGNLQSRGGKNVFTAPLVLSLLCSEPITCLQCCLSIEEVKSQFSWTLSVVWINSICDIHLRTQVGGKDGPLRWSPFKRYCTV